MNDDKVLDTSQRGRYNVRSRLHLVLGGGAMGQNEFDTLLSNVGKMTNVVEKLPDNCREMVYSSLVAALLSDGTSSEQVVEHSVKEGTFQNNVDERNFAEELEMYYRRFGLDSVNDMEYAAFLGFFFAKLAPPSEMADRIDESHYKMACLITGRDLPKRITGTMNNAKNLKGYLESHGSGIYSISPMGEHYVKHKLLKEEDQ